MTIPHEEISPIFNVYAFELCGYVYIILVWIFWCLKSFILKSYVCLLTPCVNFISCQKNVLNFFSLWNISVTDLFICLNETFFVFFYWWFYYEAESWIGWRHCNGSQQQIWAESCAAALRIRQLGRCGPAQPFALAKFKKSPPERLLSEFNMQPRGTRRIRTLTSGWNER